MAPQAEALTNGSSEEPAVEEEVFEEDFEVDEEDQNPSVSFWSLYGCAGSAPHNKMGPFWTNPLDCRQLEQDQLRGYPNPSTERVALIIVGARTGQTPC
jgi:hypothetical protein